MAKVSVIIPVHNTEKYLERCTDSILKQTLKDIEVILVENASTDNSLALCKELEAGDPRVKVIHVDKGDLSYARNTGLTLATAPYVAFMDSDDMMEPTAYEAMLGLAEKENLDVVTCNYVCIYDRRPAKYMFNEDGSILLGETKDLIAWNFSNRISHSACVMLAKKELFRTVSFPVDRYHEDEATTYRIMSLCKKGGHINHSYYLYYKHPGTITASYNFRRCRDQVSAQWERLSFLQSCDLFDENEKIALGSRSATCFFRYYRKMLSCASTADQKRSCMEFKEKALQLSPEYRLKRWQASFTRYMVRHHWRLYLAMKGIEAYPSVKKPLDRYLATEKIKRTSRRHFRHNYSDKERKISPQEKTVIIMFDGKIRHGGWADRLRGILSVYSICKELDVPFRLYFTNPFDVRDFLEPNEYDWRISAGEISFNRKEAEPIYAIDADGKAFADFLRRKIRRTDRKQLHVYTNSAYIFMRGGYSGLFHELFRPKDTVMSETAIYKELLKPEYISVSTRFMNLLGDFNEPDSTQLDKKEQERLISACMNQIELIHKEYPSCKMLVASDSYTFLCEAGRKEYVTTSGGGKPVHMDNSNGKEADESHKKTFIDFFLIADASRIFMLHTGAMYRGHFPYSASLINGRPYELIEF